MKKLFYTKYIFLLLLFTQVYLHLPAQNQHSIDSLQNLMSTLIRDSSKIPVLIELVYQYQDNDIDKAFEFAQQSYTIASRLNHKRYLGKVNNNLGNLYLLKGNFGAASGYYLEALKISESIKDDTAIAKCYNNIGKLYYQRKNHKEAMNYYLKSLAINQKLHLDEEMCTNYIHIGIISNSEKKYNEAIQNYQKALAIQIRTGNKKNIAATYSNLAVTYYHMNKLELSIESAKNAIAEAEIAGNKKYLSVAYSNLAGLYTTTKMYNEANASYNKAIKYAMEAGHNEFINTTYRNLAALYSEQKDFQKAYQYARTALKVEDSIYQINNTRQTNELMAKYESEQKESIINSLKKDNVLSEEQLKQERNFKIYLSVFSVLIASFAFVLYRRITQKRKINKILFETYKQIEEKNQSITDSINYSKRIQEAILPSRQVVGKLFAEIFNLFMPKDIVSGDFYWCAEKNGKKLIACCDCTGHGVPGALMSMIGNNILNQIVNENEITSPDEILNHLHLEIRKALKQEEQHTSKDGMDITLIVFNNDTEIEYAGANRPLWIVSGQESVVGSSESPESPESVKLKDIKPDKFSIGGYQSETERKFTKHTIQLSKGDCIYMFSDGYADQFGGKEEKKYTTKRLKELLVSNYSKSIDEQGRNLSETIIQWKGNLEQVDDILIIGIRV